jgi:hypothetical protein
LQGRTKGVLLNIMDRMNRGQEALPWEPDSPEAEFTHSMLRDAAMWAVGDLASCWARRPIARLVDPRQDEDALFAVLSVEKFGEPGLYDLDGLPPLPESEISGEAKVTAADALAELRAQLPFSDEEIQLLRGELGEQTRALGQPRPTVPNPELLKRWSGWLRDDELPSGVLPVSAAALKVRGICLRLYQAYS